MANRTPPVKAGGVLLLFVEALVTKLEEEEGEGEDGGAQQLLGQVVPGAIVAVATTLEREGVATGIGLLRVVDLASSASGAPTTAPAIKQNDNVRLRSEV